MQYKWVGAVLVVLSCGGFGIFLSASHKNEEWNLRQLASALDYMLCELQYRLTPLPELCRQAGLHAKGCTARVLLALAEELESPLCCDVGACMENLLIKTEEIPVKTRGNLSFLGKSLGRFDLEGQMKGLEAVRQRCRDDLTAHTLDKTQRLRSYQTLGLCAGAALVILFI